MVETSYAKIDLLFPPWEIGITTVCLRAAFLAEAYDYVREEFQQEVQELATDLSVEIHLNHYELHHKFLHSLSVSMLFSINS